MGLGVTPVELTIHVGTLDPHQCSQCGAEGDSSESEDGVRSVVKWIRPVCGALSEVEREFGK